MTLHFDSIKQFIQQLADSLAKNSGKVMTEALTFTTKNHVSTIYPGSQHWSHSKVTRGSSSGNQGEVNVAIPGATRAYHDINIRPVKAKSLTIPLHQAAYGKRASDIPGLFKIKSKRGNELLARNEGGNLVLMYALSKHVHQKQDKRLMPSDDSFAANIMARISKMIQSMKA